MIFEVIEKTGRKIRLTNEQWSHIRKKHPEVEGMGIDKGSLSLDQEVEMIRRRLMKLESD